MDPALAAFANTSQVGQARILAKLFGALGPGNRTFAELGFNTDEQCVGSGSNTCGLWRAGWTGTLIDGGHENTRINLHRAFITSEGVPQLLRRLRVPRRVDYLSIDLDSFDLWIFKAILASRYRPRVVSVEYNANIRWEYALTYPDPAVHNPNASALDDRIQRGAIGQARHGCFVGASARALVLAAAQHNYTAVAAAAPLDLFFVRDEEVAAYGAARLKAMLGKRDAFFPAASNFWQGVPLNTFGNKAMTAAQARELLDYGVWLEQRRAGRSVEAAAAAAREAARTAVKALARRAAANCGGGRLCGAMCFRRPELLNL